jgi:hypothetical protein
VADADLHQWEAAQPGAGEHFRVDEKAGSLGQQLGQRLLAEYLQRAVAIADARPQQRPHQQVVTPAQKAPPPAIPAVGAVADGQGILVGQGDEGGKVAQIKLAIRVGERDAVKPGSVKPGAQGRPVAAVRFMAEQAHARPAGGGLGDHVGRVIAAAVVHDEDFVVADDAGEGLVRLLDGPADVAGFVVRGNDQRKGAVAPVHGPSPSSVAPLAAGGKIPQQGPAVKRGQRPVLGGLPGEGWLSPPGTAQPRAIASERGAWRAVRSTQHPGLD